jgi:hypothetical protein
MAEQEAVQPPRHGRVRQAALGLHHLLEGRPGEFVGEQARIGRRLAHGEPRRVQRARHGAGQHGGLMGQGAQHLAQPRRLHAALGREVALARGVPPIARGVAAHPARVGVADQQRVPALGEAGAPSRGLLVAREGGGETGERQGEQGASEHGRAAMVSRVRLQVTVFK